MITDQMAKTGTKNGGEAGGPSQDSENRHGRKHKPMPFQALPTLSSAGL